MKSKIYDSNYSELAKQYQNLNFKTTSKKLLFFLLLCAGMANAQIVDIPDANFKAALIADGIDINSDGEIQALEALLVNQLHVDNENITSLIGLESFLNVTSLYCDNNAITFLDLSSNPNINYIKCSYNLLSTINVSNNIGLTDLLCDHNNLTGINVSNNPNLTDLWLSHNNLTSLDISSCNSLRILSCSNNILASLNLSNNLGLTDLQCSNNQLMDLNVSGMSNLTFLSCSDNSIAQLDVNDSNSIISLNCADNLLTTLDVSNQTQLNSLTCSNNQLQTLYIKNGRNESFLFLGGNPTLQFVCADDTQVATVQSILNDQGLINTVCNSYCSFTPGGSYNTITGNMKFDANNNGCDAGDIAPNNVRVNIADGTTSGASFLNNAGTYTFYTQAGSYTITPSVENPSYFTFSPPTATVTFADNLNNIAVDNFCIAPNGVHHDAEMVISPVTPARPGFDAVYKLVYKNKGNQTDDLYLNFNFNDNVLDFVSATSPVTNVSGTVQTMIPNVRPFESGSIDVTFHVNAPTDTPAVNVGDLLTFTSFVDITTDDNWLDNAFTLHQTVVGSFDPNDITCLEGEVVPPAEIGNYLHYAINFENTGTFPAENVVVKTEVDPTKFDVGSLQLMNSNFPVDARITGNKVEFIFENIQLPIGGHGHILLKIKTHNALVAGDAVAKRADIFFDYNAPIDTGFANTVFQTLSNTDFEIDNSVIVAPNPASSEVNIKASNSIKSIELYDVRGSIISISIVDELESKLDISSHSKGIYFIKIITKKGIQVQKLLKD